MSTQPLTSSGPKTQTATSHLQANLDALAAHTPNTVSLLRASPPPNDWIAAIGRDGVNTYRRPRPDGTVEWLGRTSMPTVTAAAMLSNFQPAGCNLALPGIGTGYEATKILGILPCHCALFVFESDPWRAKLVLGMVDLTDALRDGRLLLLLGNHQESDLIEFFRRNEGYRFPEQMVQFATQDLTAQQQCQDLLARAAVPITQRQANAWKELAQRIQNKPQAAGAAGSAPRVTVIADSANEAMINKARNLIQTAEHAEWDCVGALTDHPRRGHHLARLRAVVEHDVDWVLALNDTPDALRRTLTAGLPVVTWFVAQRASGSIQPPSADEARHVVFAASASAVAATPDNGASPSAKLLEIGVHAGVFYTNESEADRRKNDARDVVVIADLPMREPDTLGFTQSSQRRIWQAIVQSCAAGGAAADLLDADRHIAEALRQTGITLEDAKLRERFVDKIRTHAAPHAAIRRVVGALRSQPLTLDLWGNGWDAIDPPIQARPSPIVDDQRRCDILRATKVLVIPWFDATSAELILQCISTGGCPVFLQPAEPLETLHPQLVEVLHLTPHAVTTDELTPLAQKILRNPPADDMQQVRRIILERHTLRHRLDALRDAADGLQSA